MSHLADVLSHHAHEENSRKDVVLEPGACFRIDKPGLTLVQAFGDASLSFA